MAKRTPTGLVVPASYAEAYQTMHANQKTFPGTSLKPHAKDIAALIATLDLPDESPPRLLDYGCGKGYQYLAFRVHEQWGGVLPHCYDIGVTLLSHRPQGKFDGVICTDMLEHVDEPDVDCVLDDIFSFLRPHRAYALGIQTFAFLGICCRRSKKTLPDGRNSHLTVKPAEWWDAKLAKYQMDGRKVVTVYMADKEV